MQSNEKIIASFIGADGGALSDNLYNPAYLNTLELDDSQQVEIASGVMNNVPPGVYDVTSDASVYANGKIGNCRSRVTVNGGGVLDGIAGYVEQWGSFVSHAQGRITVRAGQTVGLEVIGQLDMKAGYCTTPGVLHRIVLTRV